MKLQVLSSTEAEYVALCKATREAVWLRLFMIELGFNIEAVIMWEDNQPCITQVNSENISHKVGKHINSKFHFARDQVRDKIVSVQYVSTHEQTADLFTKVLTVTQFEYLRSMLRMVFQWKSLKKMNRSILSLKKKKVRTKNEVARRDE